MDCSPPGSSVHGIFQARVLEWAAISFSSIISTTILITTHTYRVLYAKHYSKSFRYIDSFSYHKNLSVELKMCYEETEGQEKNVANLVNIIYP